jgi:hypothetical protein
MHVLRRFTKVVGLNGYIVGDVYLIKTIRWASKSLANMTKLYEASSVLLALLLELRVELCVPVAEGGREREAEERSEKTERQEQVAIFKDGLEHA